VDVVEQVDDGAKFYAETLEEFGGEVEVALGGPEAFAGEAALGGLVGLAAFGYAVAAGYSGDAALRADAR